MDEKDGIEIIVRTVGKTILHYDARCISDLHKMLKKHGDWMLLGSKDEKVETKEGSVEHWARSADNPIGGWYGLKKEFSWTICNVCPAINGSPWTGRSGA